MTQALPFQAYQLWTFQTLTQTFPAFQIPVYPVPAQLFQTSQVQVYTIPVQLFQTFQVQVYNNTNDNYAFKGATYAEEYYDNTNIIFNSLYLQNKTVLNIICKNQNSYDNKGSALRFNQLNTIIPGDQILALTPDENNLYNYRIYQVTKAPYLYNIFRNENSAGYDTFEFKKMYVNFVSYCIKM